MREFLFSILKGIYNWITKTWSNIQIPGEQMILSNLLQYSWWRNTLYISYKLCLCKSTICGGKRWSLLLCTTRRHDKIVNEISKSESGEPNFYPHNYRSECQTFAELVELKGLADFLHLDISDVYTRVSLYVNIPTLYPCSLKSTTEFKLKLMGISNLRT